MKMLEEEKKNFSLNLFNTIDNILKVQELKISLGEEKSVNGIINTLEITFINNNKPYKVNYDFFTRDYLEHKVGMKKKILDLIIEIIFYNN